MAITLTLTGKTPGQQQFGLDTFMEHYKCDATADVVLTDGSVPSIGSAHPDYATMFVTARYCTETSESASALDLTYMGTLSGDLPAQKHDSSVALQSSSSSFGTTGIALSSPATIQFYAPTNTLSYISSGGPGTDTADDPTADIIVLTWSIGILSFAIVDQTLADLVDTYFSILITENHSSTEIVAGHFWSNTSTTAKAYVPMILNFPPGAYLALSSAGTGYSAGDTLTISGGSGTATIVVTGLGISNSITNWTVSSISCTTADFNVPAGGGSGTGAQFNIIIIT